MVQYPEFQINYDQYKKFEADRYYLPMDQLFFDNDIIGVQHVPGYPEGITPIWRNGFIAPIKWPAHLESKVESVVIPKESIIYRIVLFYNPRTTQLGGLQFFDPNDKLILKAGNTHPDAKTHETILREGLKILGAKSRLWDSASSALCFDFLFVVGYIADL